MTEGPGEASGEELSFDKAEFASPTAARVCARCQTSVQDEYFEAQASVLCPECASDLGSGGPLLRPFGFGLAAMAVCTLGWFLIIKLTDSEWGLVAIGVGLLIGFAVRHGSLGRGGFKYQALAMALTYASITFSHVPFVIQGLTEAQSESQASEGARPTPKSAPPPASAEPDAPPTSGGFVMAWGIVLLIALVSPFLAGTSGLMGLVIIAIALYEAWKINRRVPISGPFRLGLAPATP